MQIDVDKYFVHSNGWWWGCSVTLIRKDGVGMIELQFSNRRTNTCFIVGLSVTEDNRRQGIGSSLLSLAETLAREEGKRYLELDVEYNNEWLINWYQRIGFNIIVYDDNLIRMNKPLV